jgi:hypothetical protein
LLHAQGNEPWARLLLLPNNHHPNIEQVLRYPIVRAELENILKEQKMMQ